MVELRWVIALRQYFDHTDGREYTKHERVLQYRQHNGTGGMGKWKDVPDIGLDMNNSIAPEGK